MLQRSVVGYVASFALTLSLVLSGCGGKGEQKRTRRPTKKPKDGAVVAKKDGAKSTDGKATKKGGKAADQDGKTKDGTKEPPKEATKDGATKDGTTKKKAANVPDAGWGTLRGRFVLKGKAPNFPPIAITRDQEFCGKLGLQNERLVVGKDGGIANIAIWLRLKSGETPPKEHPSYAKPATADARLDNKGCRFEPHVVMMRNTQKLVLGNLDKVAHNAKGDSFGGVSFNPQIIPGSTFDVKFPEPETAPVGVSCGSHAWMNSWVIVTATSYSAVSDTSGRFEIANIPPGEWTFQFWQESAGNLASVEVGGKATKWSRGRLKVKIEAGKVMDLGDVSVEGSAFED